MFTVKNLCDCSKLTVFDFYQQVQVSQSSMYELPVMQVIIHGYHFYSHFYMLIELLGIQLCQQQD